MLRKSRRFAVAFLLAVAMVASAPAAWASLISGCDGEGRFHVFIIDDDTGEVTGHLWTTNPDSRCG